MNTTTNHHGRTLVLCFDGTASQFDGDNTNVVKLFSLLKKDEPDKQLVYYQPGVGTFAKPGVLTPALLWCAKMVDMAIAWYLDEHVLGGYMFLMQNYKPGDRIVMFGFSRGAYTARSLAGMLHKVGLLPRDNLHHAPFAYKMYRRNDATGFEQSRRFKQTFSRSVEIDFMGLWDTVSSVGVIHARTLPFTSSNATVRTFRHALSLDEHRSRFRPTLWEHSRPSADHPEPSCGKRQRRGTQSAPPTATHSPAAAVAPSLHIIAESEGVRTAGPSSVATGGRSPAPPPHLELPGADLDEHVGLHTPVPSPAGVIPLPEADGRAHDPEKTAQTNSLPDKEATKDKKKRKFKIPYLHQWRKQRKLRELESLLAFEREFDKSDSTDAERWRAHAGSPSPRMGRKTDVLEVWFAGGHSDVGGGNDLDSEPHMLSNVPFHWMVREAIHAQVGLLFDRGGLARHNLHLDAFMLSPRHRMDSGIAGLGLSLSAPVTPFLGLSRAASRESESAAGDHAALSQAFRPPRGPTSSSLQLNVYGPDVLCRVRDELKDQPLWWALELFPSPYWFQNGKGKWKRSSKPNMGRPRIIPERDPHVHWSVRTRMDHEELAYRPRATWQGDPLWVF